ncbi:ParB/RepB/Spo0J family partition protein (plasmid) [Paraburkholderia ginsengisoli]|uniref:ParB/RepB/Spo0J family partition protein n=1 Tax=Paraburkholderia ginsengisoli TaxID=311231 RepID=A0A7T4NA29_9BURK|nr:ParB/RepB/Spo0J family partition protein [Paraburkholderia ginsengisoli]
MLCQSPHNVRRKAPTGIEALAENIAAAGVMQNLVAHEMKSRGKQRKLGVCAGQRRLLALELLRTTGRIDDSYAVPVKIVSEADAVAVSLIENQQREPMHPADACEAFRLLVSEGRTVDYIAALFSLSELQVQRHLKLANVSTRLLDVFREDGMTLEQIRTLALTDDHALQEHLWFDAAQSWQRNPAQLRAAITDSEIDAADSHLVAFVTLDAYEAAGGTVRRDLFSDEQNAGYVTDAGLLQRLVAEKLASVAQTLSADGWSWVETRVRRDFGEMARYGRLPSASRDYTKKEKTELRALKKASEQAAAELNAYYDAEDEDEQDAEDFDRLDALQDAANAASQAVDDFADRLEIWSDEQKARAGAFVTLDHDGHAVIERGLVKPEDRASVTRDGVSGAAELPAPAEKPLHGKDLSRRLTAHRTAAVQIELARNPVAALAVLMHRLIPVVFSERYVCVYDQHAADVRATCSHDRLLQAADDMETSAAWQEISAEREKWAALLPKRFSDVLPWLMAQREDVMSNLFAFCVASTVNSVSESNGSHPVNLLLNLLDVDMAKYWTPTRASYLNHVSKARIVEVVAQAVSAEAAAPLEKLKKAAAAETAERLLADSRWLPDVLASRETPVVWDDDEDEEDAA